MNMLRNTICILLINLLYLTAFPQDKGLTNTVRSPYAKLTSIDLESVKWTQGFWAERFHVCEQSMVPRMMGKYLDDSISHGFANFEIAAGIKEGEHIGPPFHDGDFYKILEALIVVQSVNKDQKLEQQIDSIIAIIAQTQRDDGYIHTPVVIEQNKDVDGKNEFGERLDFETYNMGHLMTAACVHYRLTSKKDLLNIAIKATDFLYGYYQRKPGELAQNAICPSHYMGVTEMYRTTRDPKYLELAKGLIDIRKLVEDGTDHNQDRIPFRKQTKAIGHAVRANYLYAGVADVYTETGDDSLFAAMDAIWHDLVERKLYITGACGALYDGVSPNGTTYNPPLIQQVHQAYGQDYQLPNHSAHNESCANIGNLLWNWRMLQATAEAKYADVMEQIMYNSLLAGVSLDGKGYFYTNPLSVSQDITYDLRWSKMREEYISYCNCCPPNTVRTISEIQGYMYSQSEKGIYVNFYGGNRLNTKLADGSKLELIQNTDYPWDGKVEIELLEVPKSEFEINLRIPGWSENASLAINGSPVEKIILSGAYFTLNKKWKKGDKITLTIPIKPDLVASNPLVEETRNQVAVQLGPVVFCLETEDIQDGFNVENITIPATIELTAIKEKIGDSEVAVLKGEAMAVEHKDWENTLYRKIDISKQKVAIKLIPYYAWGNRGIGDMAVWLPLSR